jgi:hypothetical protein
MIPNELDQTMEIYRVGQHNKTVFEGSYADCLKIYEDIDRNVSLDRATKYPKCWIVVHAKGFPSEMPDLSQFYELAEQFSKLYQVSHKKARIITAYWTLQEWKNFGFRLS